MLPPASQDRKRMPGSQSFASRQNRDGSPSSNAPASEERSCARVARHLERQGEGRVQLARTRRARHPLGGWDAGRAFLCFRPPLLYDVI